MHKDAAPTFGVFARAFTRRHLVLWAAATIVLTGSVFTTPAADSANAASAEKDAPLTIYVVRHGQTDWNLEDRIQGDTDNPLNEKGRKQASEVAEKLAGVKLDHIYPSGLSRAIQTAEAFSNVAEITPTPALNERSRGIYEGKVTSKVADEFNPRFAALDDDMDGGESLSSIAEWVGKATREIAERHPGGTVMIVGHSGVNPLVIGELIGLPAERAIAEIKQGNDEVYKLEIQEGNVRIWKLVPDDKLDEL